MVSSFVQDLLAGAIVPSAEEDRITENSDYGSVSGMGEESIVIQ
jgi:hypothetical protein